jgi:hypothetical protein
MAEIQTKPRYRRAEASEYLKIKHGIILSTSTLASLASRGGGPRFQKDGPFPTYTPEELDAFAARRLSRPVASTSELSAA